MLRTIREYVDFQAKERPDAVYLIAPEPKLRMTFGGLQKASRKLTHYLVERGIRPGEKVALLMHNGYQTCRLFIGAMYGGFCVTPLNLLAQASQLEYVLNHSDATIIFVTPDQLERLNAALVNVAREIQIVVCDVDAEEFIAAPDRIAEMPPVSEEHDALMMYTSGTTGKPKGVVLTNRSVVSGGQFVSAAHELGPQDRVMASLPLYHINAQIVTATAPLVHGGSLVLPHRFGVSNFWSLVARYQCSWINLVPTMISYLLNGQEAAKNDLDLSRVRFCRSASAPLPPSQHRAFEDRFKIGVIETMGLTETAAPCFTNPLESAQRKIGSPGQAFGNEAKIINPEGDSLPSGATGEIMVRGPNVMKGYYKNPEETARSMTAEGWLHTGDLGHLDEDGFVFVTGRIKELIIKGGENIAPREIDEALLKHPSVLEAAAVGIPDQHYGQEIMVCVVLKAGEQCSEDELRAFCQNELGAYKTPKLFRFQAELPKGPSGKVQRLKLLETAAG
ncbi:AMP-binding protein [Undibacterium arcticum]|uniref:AMP-binding protein n=2 Tax=Undibacterium arcticum TaxID=1762892 RepID=A0ABV7EVH5_9BURK